MKKIMALLLVATMLLCMVVVYAEDAVVTEETPVEAISEESEVAPITEEVEPETLAVSTITLQINNKTMFKDDEKIELDVPAQLINDRTLVPMRAIFEALGAEVTWDDATWTAKGTKGDIVVEIAIDSNIIYVNGAPVEIDVPAQLVDSRTLVPARAVSEAFGSTVTWIEDSETVIILTPVVPANEEPVDEETEEATEEVVESEESTEEATEEPTEEVAEDEVTEEPAEETEGEAESTEEPAEEGETVEEPESEEAEPAEDAE